MSITHITVYLQKTIQAKANWRRSLIRVMLLSLFISQSAFAKTMPISDLPPPANLPTSLGDSANSNYAIPQYVIVRSSDEITFSSETTASVQDIRVKEGSAFKKGDVLLDLDCRVQEADLQKALAQQAAADIALQSANKLKSYQAISDFELTQTKSQSLVAAAEVKKLSAIVDKCTIKAPFNGAVSELMVHPLETVKPGDPLLKIVNTENLDLESQVPSTWLAWLHIGSLFDVHVNEINQTVRVRVTRINPQIDSVSQTVKIIGNLVTPNSRLLPGMSGQATFIDNPLAKKSSK